MMTRDMIGRAFPNDPRLQREFEDQLRDTQENMEGVRTAVAATSAIQDATVLTLSPNEAFSNERVIVLGDGLESDDVDGEYRLKLSTGIPRAMGGFSLNFTVAGDSSLLLPLAGRLATVGNQETLENKTLAAPSVSGLVDAANDTAAGAAGVAVGGIYRNGSQLLVRVS